MDLVRQLVNQLPFPAQLWTPDGTVITTNSAFNELFGLPVLFDWAHHGMSLANDPQIISTGADVMVRRALEGMPADISSLQYDLSRNPHCEHKRDESLLLFINFRPLLDENHDLKCVVSIVSDVASSQVRAERDMMRSQKMENIERLAAGVSHEFNNIFTGIKGMTDLIKDEVDSSNEIYEFADSIQQNIARGAGLIDKLSSFARDLPITLKRHKLSQYLQKSLSLMQMHVQRRVTIELDVINDGEVLIDTNRLDQALSNIMLNARDAMSGQGQVLLVVDHRSPELDPADKLADFEWIMLEVNDSGPGMPPELRERALEPFFTTKERGKATGLGLSVATRIITSHNGLIQIGESERLGGAAIRLYFPLADVN